MAEDIKGTLNEVVGEIKKFVADAAEMRVETWYVPIGLKKEDVLDAKGHADFRKAGKPLAQTIVKFDGDSINVIPMRVEGDKPPEKDEDLLGLHENNVKAAVDYRTKVVDTFMDLLKDFMAKV